jgi:hypothetical protein
VRRYTRVHLPSGTLERAITREVGHVRGTAGLTLGDWPVLVAAPWFSAVLPDSCDPSGRGCRVKAHEATRAAWP